MSIYTKSGDKGETGVLGGRRISKNSLRITAIGEIDELNAVIGMMQTQKLMENTAEILQQIQNDLFMIGAELADPEDKGTAPLFKATNAEKLEHWIDEREKKLPPLKNFILPGGTPFAAYAHLARAVCRRAERAVVTLHEKEPTNQQIIIYFNRLSDLLFMLARENNLEKKQKETLWNP